MHVNEFQASTLLASQGISCQIHAVGKAERILFADLVTNVVQ